MTDYVGFILGGLGGFALGWYIRADFERWYRKAHPTQHIEELLSGK